MKFVIISNETFLGSGKRSTVGNVGGSNGNKTKVKIHLGKIFKHTSTNKGIKCLDRRVARGGGQSLNLNETLRTLLVK